MAMAQHAFFPPAVWNLTQASASAQAPMGSAGSWSHYGVPPPPTHSAPGDSEAPSNGTIDGNSQWGYGGVQQPMQAQIPAMPPPRYNNKYNVEAIPGHVRKQILIDFFLKHVDYDDIMRGLFLVFSSEGLPGAGSEEQLAFEAPFPQHTQEQTAVANAAALPPSTTTPPPPPSKPAPGIPDQDAWLNAMMAENAALKRELLVKSHTQTGSLAGSDMQLPVRPSLADLIPELPKELPPHLGPAASRAAFDAYQMYNIGSTQSPSYWHS